MNDEQVSAIVSRREKEVVDLLLRGMSNKQIALALGISERTIEFHLNNIYNKLHVASRVELILKLGRTTGRDSGNPVESTVETERENPDNGNQPAQTRAGKSWRNTVSLIKKEVAVAIHISFEELEDYLRSHPVLFSLLVFSAASLSIRYVILDLGLYAWASYWILGLLLGWGSLKFGRLTKSASQFSPLLIIVFAVLLPWLAAGLDQLYLNTVLRYTGPVSTTLLNLSARAEWLTAPNGTGYRSTHLSTTSDLLWIVTIGYMLMWFGLSRRIGRRPGKETVAAG